MSITCIFVLYCRTPGSEKLTEDHFELPKRTVSWSLSFLTKICNGSDKYVTDGIYEYIHVIRLNAIDNIRIPWQPWDGRLLSMIGRLMRETFRRNHKKQISVNWLQNDRNQKKTAGFKSSNLMGELRPAKGISLSFNKIVVRAGRTNSTIKKATKPKKKRKVI